MVTSTKPSVVVFDDILDASYIGSKAIIALSKREGHQMYREKLTQRLYRQLRNDGMTKPEAIAAVELGTGDKPLPVNTGYTWGKVSSGELERMRFPEYHQLKRRRF